MSALAKLLKNLTSLDNPEDQSLGETAVDIAAGFVPGLGTAQALRDFERARREGDGLGMALSGAAALPIVGGAFKGARKIFGGVKGATKAELEALEQAKALRKYDPKAETWKSTGWMETPDKSWMNEIDDSKASLKTVKGTNQLFLDHPELLKRYPHLKDYRIELADLPSNIKADHSRDGVIRINRSLPEDQRLNVVLHEFQHGVDLAEGRRYGANFEPGDEMDALASQLRSAYRSQETVNQAGKARKLVDEWGLSPKEAADEIVNSTGADLNDSLLAHLLKNPQDIEAEKMVTGSLVDQLKAGNVKPTAFENYLREPSEVRARTTQLRQQLSPQLRRENDPAKDMQYFIDNPVPLADQLRLYSPLKY